MATRKPAAKAAKPGSQIMHEINDARGEHRIVTIVGDKTITGEWARTKDIARLENLRACTGETYLGVLPMGVFRMATVPSIIL